jgi:hypothetical protein
MGINSTNAYKSQNGNEPNYNNWSRQRWSISNTKKDHTHKISIFIHNNQFIRIKTTEPNTMKEL